MIRGKRGQFYLIAAIIIATILIGIVAVTNYSKRESNIRLFDIKEELEIESAKVLDFGTFNEFDEAEMDALIEEFINDYISQTDENNLYFIFGDTESIKLIAYQELSEAVTVGIGGENVLLEITEGEIFTEDFSPTGNKVVINVDNSEYEFKLNKGDNFYFVISQETSDGEVIVSG